ncbi:hypothetical protein KUV57_12255 [Epibacterium sp. DP7N7-1]|nr:hypothetical protein [Epibacterium sp. DP7N7-1]
MLSLTEFRLTRERVSPEEASKKLQITDDYWSGEEDAILIYDGSLFIMEMKDGTFETYVEREGYRGALEEMEKTLFLEWYCCECADSYTTEQLSDLLTVWCGHHEIKPASADEILLDVYQPAPEDRTALQCRQGVWLEWFIRTWEATQVAEDTAAPGPAV